MQRVDCYVQPWYFVAQPHPRVLIGVQALQHFPIVQALCRIVLADANDAARQQVERLRDALLADDSRKEAEQLTRLLISTARNVSMSPSRLVRSRSSGFAGGELLTPQVGMPVDRETAVPLATVVFPQDVPQQAPIFSPDLQSAIQSLIDEWTNLDKLEAMNVQPARSCLIYGPPGTGKTHLALWICGQLQLPAVVAKLDGLVSSFLGTTSRNIGQLFAFATRYRCVLVLDEFDAIAKVRDDPQEVGEIKRVVNTLLQNLDLRKDIGLTIGVTNHESLLDTAVWRRFDAQLAIPLPSSIARNDILQKVAQPLDIDRVQSAFLTWLTHGMSGADIEQLIQSLKKAIVLSDKDVELIPLLKKLLPLHSGRIGSDRTAALLLESAELAQLLHRVSQLDLNQSDLADLFNRDKGTVSRWLRRMQEEPVTSRQ